jgi:TRAP-type mannitol/chloroaromatic compound transport system substrate-binding protein
MSSDGKHKLQRRKLVKNALLGGAALSLGCTGKKEGSGSSQVASGKTFSWKMVTTWPKNFPGLGTGANRLAKNIELMSAGRLKIKVYGAGELVPALGVFDAVSRGTAQMGHGAAYYWKGKHEASQFFGAVPFGLNANEMTGWLYHGGGQELWDELYAPFNVKAFSCGNTGVQMGGWFKKEMRSINDFKGLKMRIPGLGGDVLKQVGTTVVNLPGGEIFQALQTGTIDATEWVGPHNDLAFGFYKAAKFYYWPGWHEPGATIEATFNKKAFDELPKDLQEIVKQACRASTSEMFAEAIHLNSKALQVLVKDHGVKLKKFSDRILKKLGDTSKEVVSEVAKRDKLSQKIYDSYSEFQKRSSSWTSSSEQAYTVARALS